MYKASSDWRAFERKYKWFDYSSELICIQAKDIGSRLFNRYGIEIGDTQILGMATAKIVKLAELGARVSFRDNGAKQYCYRLLVRWIWQEKIPENWRVPSSCYHSNDFVRGRRVKTVGKHSFCLTHRL